MNTHALRDAFTQLNPKIGDDEWDFLSDKFLLRHLKRKQHYILQGEIQQSIGFLNRGLIREFTIDPEGNENTIWFFREHQFVTDYPSLLRKIPTRNTFTCLEACELILIPHQLILEAYEAYPAYERFGRLIAEQVLIQLQGRIDDFHFLSAEDKVPEIHGQLPGFISASFFDPPFIISRHPTPLTE